MRRGPIAAASSKSEKKEFDDPIFAFSQPITFLLPTLATAMLSFEVKSKDLALCVRVENEPHGVDAIYSSQQPTSSYAAPRILLSLRVGATSSGPQSAQADSSLEDHGRLRARQLEGSAIVTAIRLFLLEVMLQRLSWLVDRSLNGKSANPEQELSQPCRCSTSAW